MEDFSQNIIILRSMVERVAGQKMQTSNDFIYLSGCIKGRMGESLGVSTLKRLWGYVDGVREPRTSTLDVLARYAGYPDWQTFVSDYCKGGGAQSSQRLWGESVRASDIPAGAEFTITWNPGRKLRLRHVDTDKFLVLESERSKVLKGDTFHCDQFILLQPLYLFHLEREGCAPCDFVVGNKGGLLTISLL